MSSRFLFLLSSAAFISSVSGQEPARTGESIYRDLCASCHGGKGEGVAGKYSDPLYGERTLASLSKYIDKNMPEDKADELDAEGSALVADYIFQQFYSADARARNHPPRIDLTHLTNRQFQESVADLTGSFLEAKPPGAPTGLRAEIYESDGMNKKSKLKKEREDAALDFDFGAGPPVEGCSAEQFSIAWEGSLLAEETGFYEFRLRTPNGARFYLNRDFRDGDKNFRDDSDARRQPALIEEWVSSGDVVREATARVFLLGGRRYPLRLDYFKYKEKAGSIRLEWKAPHAVWEVLRAPHISPSKSTRVTVVTAAFPPDDSSTGYRRGSSVSKPWHEATTKAAVETATEIVERLQVLAKAREKDADFEKKLKAFGGTFAERAFRRALTPEEKTFYVDRHFNGSIAPDVALKRSVMLALKSPRFLYPDLGGKPDDHTAAARMALVLWDSIPDGPLLEAAAKGELHTRDQLRAQATRMMTDPRAKAKLRGFFHEWLAFDEAAEMTKDHEAWPDFDEAVLADLRESLDAFVDGVVWSEASDYRQLLLSDQLLLNGRLAKFYGVQAADEHKFTPVKFDPSQRAGVFTHPYLLAAMSHEKTTAPIKRGVFLTRNILGRILKSPPMAVTFEDGKFDPSLTMREKITDLTKNSSCMGCHATINPLGFSLENYDAVGRWRVAEKDKPIDPVSDYTTADGETLQLRGPRDVASHAAGNRDAQRGFIRQMFQYSVKQPPAAYGAETVAKLHESFSKSGFNMRALLVEIAVTSSMQGLNAP